MRKRRTIKGKKTYQCLSHFGAFLGNLGKQPVYSVKLLQSKWR